MRCGVATKDEGTVRRHESTHFSINVWALPSPSPSPASTASSFSAPSRMKAGEYTTLFLSPGLRLLGVTLAAAAAEGALEVDPDASLDSAE